MPVLGLIGTEQFVTERFKNVRRSVFYQYPNGAAPLLGILSLLEEQSTNDPAFGWWEKRLIDCRSTMAYISTTVAFATTVTLDGGTFTAASGDITFTAGTNYGVKVADASMFRVGQIIKMPVILAAGGQTELFARVLGGDNATKIVFTPIKTTAAVDYDGAHTGFEVLVVGSAFAQGATGSSLGAYNKPVMLQNYCQIFRTAFQISGTALKTSAKFDETGVYKDMAKEISIQHMLELEKAFIFGERTTNSVDPFAATNAANGVLPTYTTGGILWFLRQWELGTVYGNSPTAITLDTDDQKRIIVNSAGTVTIAQLDAWYERCFRTTNNKANEKLVLCGNGALQVVNQLYKSQSVLNTDLPAGETFGMNFVKHVTPFGTVFYKTHPLFNMNPALRNCMLIVDPGYLKYRYVDGRDTELLANRQPNNADYREDEWLTEAGLELRFPEAFMFIQNVTTASQA